MKKRLLSLVLTLALVLGTMIVPAFAATTQTFKMVDYGNDANVFAADGDWLVVRTKAGAGNGWSISGNGAGTTLGITRNKDEAFMVTVNFKTGSKPTSTATKSSFNVRLNLNGSLNASEWFHPFEVYVDSTLDKPRLQFASNADATAFSPTALDDGTVLTLDYNTEYILKTAISENADGYAYFAAELYSASNGVKGDLIGLGEIKNLAFGQAYASAKFDVLTLCERFSVMSLSHYTSPTVEEPVAYVGNLTFETGVYTKPEVSKTEGTAKFGAAAYSESETVFESEMTMGLDTMQRYGYNQETKYFASTVTDGKWNRYTWNNIPVESSFVQDGSMVSVRPLNTANSGSATDSYNSYYYRNSGILVHSFTPVTDGSEFAVRMTVHPFKPSERPNKAFNMQFRLANDTANSAGTDSSKTFTMFTWGGDTYGELLSAVAGVDTTEYYVSDINSDSSKFLAKSEYEYDLLGLQEQDVVVEARFIPDGTNYNVYVTCTNAAGEVALANEEPAVIPMADVATYSRFQLNTSYEQTTANTTENLAVRYIGLKDVEIVKADLSTGLKVGDNKIYIPYRKASGDYFNAVVVAAIYDANDNLVNAYPKFLTDEETESGHVTFDLSVSDNQYVRYFVLNNFDDVTPLKNNQKALTISK